MYPDVPFTQLEASADTHIRAAFSEALTDAPVLWLSILVFTVGCGFFIWSVCRQKSAYVSKRLTRKAVHYLLPLFSIGLAILQFTESSGTSAVLFAAASTAIALTGAAVTFAGQRFGVALTMASFWMSLPLKESFLLPAVYADYTGIGQYNAAGKIAVFAVAKMILGKIAVLAILSCAITLFTIACYTRRRYFFPDAYEHWFSDASCCPVCRSPLVSDAKYCPACGEQIGALPASKLAWKPLDVPVYCPECGKRLTKNGECRNCNPKDVLKTNFENLTGGSASDQIKSALAALLVMAVVFIPVFHGDVVTRLVSGSADISNAFVEKLNAWSGNPALARDPDWLRSYDEASEALSGVNARIFDVNPDRISYTGLYSYVGYADASYLQMAVIQRINEAVHSPLPADAQTLGAYFNQTMNLQQQAIVSGLGVETGYLQKVENLVVDSLRFYLSFIPVSVLTALLFAGGLITGMGGAVWLNKYRDNTPFVKKETVSIPPEEEEAREQKHRKYVRTERIATAVGVAAAALFLTVPGFLSPRTVPQGVPAAEECMDTAFSSDGTELIAWFSDCRTNPEKALDDSERIRALLDHCMEHLDLIMQSTDAEEEMIAVSEALKELLAEVKTGLDAGELPGDDVIGQATEVIREGQALNTERLMEDAFDAIGELF